MGPPAAFHLFEFVLQMHCEEYDLNADKCGANAFNGSRQAAPSFWTLLAIPLAVALASLRGDRSSWTVARRAQ